MRYILLTKKQKGGLFLSQQSTKIPADIMKSAWALALGAIAPMLDSTMVNIAVNQLTQEFKVPLDIVQWSITGYVLALAIAVPISGWFMDQFNSKKVFIFAATLFGLVSIGLGLSWTIQMFIILRLIQGFSAGIITTLMSTMLVKIAGEQYLGRVMAIVSTPMILGPIFGPVLGGFIIHTVSWHWIFFINVIITLVLVPIMAKVLPSFSPINQSKRLDIIGVILLSLISVLFIDSVTEASKKASFTNIETVVTFLSAIGLVVIYLIYNRKKNYATVLPTTLFTQRNYGLSSLGLFLANIAVLGPMILFPIFFQRVNGFNETEAAMLLMPQGIGMLIARPYIGRLTDQYGAKIVIIVCVSCSVIGTLPFIFISQPTPIIFDVVALFIRGLFVGGIMLPLTNSAYIGLNSKAISEAGVGINMIENIGSSFGSALMASITSAALTYVHVSNLNIATAYHLGFGISIIILMIIIVPALFLKSMDDGENNAV